MSADTFFYHCAIAYLLYHKIFSQCTQLRIPNCTNFCTIMYEVNFIMTVKDAVAKRFEQLCDQRGIRPNELATRAGVTPSTVYSMLDPSRQRVSIATIKKLCDGLDITLGQFFSCALFDELEQEIQ